MKKNVIEVIQNSLATLHRSQFVVHTDNKTPDSPKSQTKYEVTHSENGRRYYVGAILLIALIALFLRVDDLIAWFHQPHKALMDEAFFNTNFNRLYVLHQSDPNFFSLQAQNYPYYQIWRVNQLLPPSTD